MFELPADHILSFYMRNECGDWMSQLNRVRAESHSAAYSHVVFDLTQLQTSTAAAYRSSFNLHPNEWI